MAKYETVSRHVLQDGADFYLYSDATEEDYLYSVQAPFRVQDFDSKAAEAARTWFINVWCRETGIDATFN